MTMLDQVAQALGYVPIADATDADSFEAQLRAIAHDPSERAQYREAALTIAKCGATPADVMVAVREVVSGSIRSEHNLRMLRRRIDEMLGEVQR